MDYLEYFFETACLFTLFFTYSGFFIYKLGHADTWEDGIKNAFSTIYNFLYEGATGKSPVVPEKEIDVRLYLSSEEMLGLTKELEKVYEQLQLSNGIIYTEDIAWFDYYAFCITPKYKELSLTDRKRLLTSIINKYYQEIHGTLTVPIYIKICSECRLYFAVALNMAGQSYLEKQEAFNNCTEQDFCSEYSSKIIEESISEDTNNDFRL